MITYRLLRTLGRLALRWFYRNVEIVGIERVPDDGAVLLASNHPNALVDALVIGCTLDRPVTLTAKATLLDHPVTRALLRAVGVVPLRRASDEVARAGKPPSHRHPADQAADASAPALRASSASPTAALDPARNAQAFAAVLDALAQGGAVLLFPEGKSHSEPALAPLKTGLARIALMARDERGVVVPIVPIGLTFERKWDPRTRVVMQVGAPIVADGSIPNDADGVATLTRRVDRGLRDVTLNFASEQEAERLIMVSGVLAEILDDFRPLGSPDPPLAVSVRLAQHVTRIAAALPRVTGALALRVERFMARLDAFERTARGYAVSANDVQMSTSVASGVWFVVRELLIALVTGPLALWGRVNHWVPLRLARWFAVRTSRSPDEPAMRTMVTGLVFVLAFYVGQTSAVAFTAGPIAAAVYALSLPLSATWDLRYADRRRRAAARVRTYLRLRRDPALGSELAAELAWLRDEARALNDALNHVLNDTGDPGPGSRDADRPGLDTTHATPTLA